MRNFFMLSASVFLLTVSALLLPFRPGIGDVGAVAQSDILAVYGNLVVDRFEQVWEVEASTPGCWRRVQELDLPIPWAEVVSWEGGTIMATSGDSPLARVGFGWSAGTTAEHGQVSQYRLPDQHGERLRANTGTTSRRLSRSTWESHAPKIRSRSLVVIKAPR